MEKQPKRIGTKKQTENCIDNLWRLTRDGQKMQLTEGFSLCWCFVFFYDTEASNRFIVIFSTFIIVIIKETMMKRVASLDQSKYMWQG